MADDGAQAMTQAAQREAFMEMQRQQKELLDEKKRLELALQVASKEDKVATQEVKELELSGKEYDEQLSWLKDRVAAVTSELSTLKLNKALEDALQTDTGRNENDPNLEITTFRELAPVVNKAFKKALDSRFHDPGFVEQLSDQNAASRPEFCTVLWQGESAQWKVHDPRDGTEVTFGSLLQDVSRYWGMHHADMCFQDLKGAAWPLELFVWDELGPTGDVTVQLARRPRTAQLDVLEYAYEDDESTLPLAVQRKLDRERRAKQLERHTKDSIRKQKARVRQAQVNELVKYVCMMFLYFWVLDARRNVRQAFLLTDAMRTAFIDEEFGDYNEKNFEDIRTYEEFYMWATGPFTEGLLPAEYYDGTEIPADKKRVMYYNRVVGGLRLRQVRVTPNEGCNIQGNVITKFEPTKGPDAGTERLRKYVAKCYSNYRKFGTWSRRPFSVMAQNVTGEDGSFIGPPECEQYYATRFAKEVLDPRRRREYDQYERCLGRAHWPTNSLVDPESGETNVTDPLLLAFTWRDGASNSLPNFGVGGKNGGFFDGSGFVFDLTNLTTQSLVEAFEYLQENTWLDRETRALFISLVVYNANFNLYSVLNFRLELSLAGVLTPVYNLQTVKMDLIWSFMDTTKDLAYFAVEVIMYVGMLYYLLNEFRELYSIYSATGGVMGYFQDFWNVIDWTLIFLSFMALGMRINFVFSPAVRAFDPFVKGYVEITSEATMYNDSFAFDAIAATFGIFKILRFFDLQRNLLILRASLERGVQDLTSFTFVLLLIMAGFSFSGMNIFGQENEEYVTFGQSFITLFLTVLGEFDFERMINVDLIFGYGFFIIYQMLVFLVMVNIFLAILNDAYLFIKEKYDKEEQEEGPPPVSISQRIQQFRQYLRQRKLDQRIETLRKQQRQRELVERRANRRVEETRAKTLKGMGIDPAAQARAQAGGQGAGGDGSALMRTEEL